MALHRGMLGAFVLGGPRAVLGGPFDGSAPPPALVIYIDPRAVQLVIAGSDSDVDGIDPRAVQLVSGGSDSDPYGIDPRAVQLVS